MSADSLDAADPREATPDDTELTNAVRDVFGATCSHAAVQAAERDGWAGDVWARAAEMGLPWVGVPEAAGGAGGTLHDAMVVLTVAGAHAAPIPLAETGMLGGWLLASTGYRVQQTPISVVPGRAEDSLRLVRGRVSGMAHRVPWARAVDGVAALVAGPEGNAVALLPTAAMRVDRATNLAGEPRDTIHLEAVEPIFVSPAPPGVDAESLRLRGALSRVALMAGALEAMSEATLRYTGQREQFGKPVGSFQAVQQHLVVGAQEAALVSMAAAVAERAVAHAGGARDAEFEIACAKALADQGAQTATRAAHQAHGAMGMTQEYSLHQLSRRLWSWRTEYGSPGWWRRRVGGLAAAARADGLYPLITGR